MARVLRQAVGAPFAGPGPRPALLFATLGVLGLVVFGLPLALWPGTLSPVGLSLGAVFYVTALAIATLDMARSYPHGRMGACNAVTLVRLMLAAVLVTWVPLPPETPWLLVAVATVAFALDGVDGWLARRAGLASAFGARFDVEVDSVLALALSVHLFQSGNFGAYVLLLGLPRYLYLGAQYVWPWLNGPLPERFSRKVVCVVQIGALIVLLVPVLPQAVANALALGAAGALIWSFALDVRALWRARP